MWDPETCSWKLHCCIIRSPGSLSQRCAKTLTLLNWELEVAHTQPALHYCFRYLSIRVTTIGGQPCCCVWHLNMCSLSHLCTFKFKEIREIQPIGYHLQLSQHWKIQQDGGMQTQIQSLHMYICWELVQHHFQFVCVEIVMHTHADSHCMVIHDKFVVAGRSIIHVYYDVPACHHQWDHLPNFLKKWRIYYELENFRLEVFCVLNFQVEKFSDAPYILYYILYWILNV